MGSGGYCTCLIADFGKGNTKSVIHDDVFNESFVDCSNLARAIEGLDEFFVNACEIVW